MQTLRVNKLRWLARKLRAQRARTAGLGCWLAALALAGCTPGSAPVAGVALSIGGPEPVSLNPIFNNGISQNNLLRLMFEPLVASDAKGESQPALAATVPTVRNGGISADGLTITYHLRHDVRWHDGVAFTSRDIAFSTRAMLEATNPIASRRGYDQIQSLTTPDLYTVRIRLRRRFAPFVATYFSESDYPIYPVPAHRFAGAANLAHSAFAANPVGTGPFEFVKWDRGNKIDLRANSRYFRGVPKIQTLSWHCIDNENTKLAQLRSGEVDMVMALSPAAAAQLRGDPRVRLVSSPVNGYFGFMFNTRRVSDVRVRRAIAAAIDARAVRTDITYGFDRPAIADLPSFLWATDPRLRPLRYDLETASALMHSAGYGPHRPLPLEIAIIAGRRTDASWAVLLQATLARIDVVVHIHAYAPAVYGGTVSENGVLATGRYDATPYFFIAGTDPDDSSQFLCNQRPPAGYNVSFYCTPEMDAAQRPALERYDRQTRKLAYAQIEKLLLRDVPIFFAGSPTDTTAVRRDFIGFAPNLVTPSARADQWSLRHQ